MSDLTKRMRATLRYGIIEPGSDSGEYAVARGQFADAADRIKELESQVKRVESLPDQWLSLKPHNAISQIQYDAAITALRMCVEQLNKALEVGDEHG